MAKVFKVAGQLVNSVGAGTSMVKEMTLRYIADKCADWILANGGFVSTVVYMSTLTPRSTSLFFNIPDYVCVVGTSTMRIYIDLQVVQESSVHVFLCKLTPHCRGSTGEGCFTVVIFI